MIGKHNFTTFVNDVGDDVLDHVEVKRELNLKTNQSWVTWSQSVWYMFEVDRRMSRSWRIHNNMDECQDLPEWWFILCPCDLDLLCLPVDEILLKHCVPELSDVICDLLPMFGYLTWERELDRGRTNSDSYQPKLFYSEQQIWDGVCVMKDKEMKIEEGTWWRARVKHDNLIDHTRSFRGSHTLLVYVYVQTVC